MKTLRMSVCAALLILSCHTTLALANDTVQNNTETTGEYIDGSVITAKVKAKIATNKHLNNTNISVSTQNDTVILTGVVHSEWQKDKAEKIAKLVDGVKKVDNQLKVAK